MLAAALEASLMATVHCFSEEVLASKSKPMKDGAPKPLIGWSLFELLRVAKELNLLPAQLSLDEEFDDDKALIGDYAEVVRQIRNLVHPARYVEDLPHKRVAKRHLELSYEVLDIATDYLTNRVVNSLQSVIDDVENEG
jgi:hypothetical protein